MGPGPIDAGLIDAGQAGADGLATSSRTPRKRLGKSLKDLNPQGVSKPKPSQDPSS